VLSRIVRNVRFLRGLSGACLITLVISSCTTHKASHAAGRGSNSPSAPHATDGRVSQILRAYSGYWERLLVDSDPANPGDQKLAAYVTGTELKRARQVLKARQQAHELVRGKYGHADRVSNISDNTARVADCLSILTKVIDVKTKKQKRTDPRGPFPLTVTMTLDGKTWKVSEIAPGSQSCLSKARPVPTPSKTR
jgi:hypothetical protein